MLCPDFIVMLSVIITSFKIQRRCHRDQYNDIKRNDIQHCVIMTSFKIQSRCHRDQYKDIQRNDIQHCDT